LHAPESDFFRLDSITFIEECDADNESVIACAPSELPAGFAERRN